MMITLFLVPPIFYIKFIYTNNSRKHTFSESSQENSSEELFLLPQEDASGKSSRNWIVELTSTLMAVPMLNFILHQLFAQNKITFMSIVVKKAANIINKNANEILCLIYLESSKLIRKSGVERLLKAFGLSSLFFKVNSIIPRPKDLDVLRWIFTLPKIIFGPYYLGNSKKKV